MRLKDLHSNDKEQIVWALLVQERAFQAMKAQVLGNDTTLPRLYDSLCSAQRRIGRLAHVVARMAEQEVPH